MTQTGQPEPTVPVVGGVKSSTDPAIKAGIAVTTISGAQTVMPANTRYQCSTELFDQQHAAAGVRIVSGGDEESARALHQAQGALNEGDREKSAAIIDA